MVAPDFEKFSSSGGVDGLACAKCGAVDPPKRWHGDKFDCRFIGREHMHMTCRGCGFDWPTAPLDAQ